MRRLGLDDDTPAAVVNAMRRDVFAAWLPEAFATLCAIVAGIGGAKLTPGDFLDAWGLDDPENTAAGVDADAAASVERLRAWSARRETERTEERR